MTTKKITGRVTCGWCNTGQHSLCPGRIARWNCECDHPDCEPARRAATNERK